MKRYLVSFVFVVALMMLSATIVVANVQNAPIPTAGQMAFVVTGSVDENGVIDDTRSYNFYNEAVNAGVNENEDISPGQLFNLWLKRVKITQNEAKIIAISMFGHQQSDIFAYGIDVVVMVGKKGWTETKYLVAVPAVVFSGIFNVDSAWADTGSARDMVYVVMSIPNCGPGEVKTLKLPSVA